MSGSSTGPTRSAARAPRAGAERGRADDGGLHHGGRRRHARRRARRDLRHHGTFRLRQVDAGAVPVAPDRAHRRRGHLRRPQPARCLAARVDRAPAPQDGHGVPALRAAAASHRARQRRFPARDPRRGAQGARGARARDDRARRARRAGKTIFRTNFPAASSSASASPARSPSVRTSGFSTSRSRRSIPDPARDAERIPAPAIGAAKDDRVHHPRFRRGDQARRSHRHHAGRAHRPDRDAGGPRVCRPADGYVAEFTREAPRAKILSARAIARPKRNGETLAGSIPADSRVAEFAKQVEASPAPSPCMTPTASSSASSIARRSCRSSLAARRQR